MRFNGLIFLMMLLDAILIHTYAYAMRPDASIGIPDPHHSVDMAPDPGCQYYSLSLGFGQLRI